MSDSSDRKIEEQLRKLTPAPPSGALWARLLSPPTTRSATVLRPRSGNPLRWVRMAAALAVLTAGAWIWHQTTRPAPVAVASTPEAEPAALPHASIQISGYDRLLGARQSGTVLLPSGEPVKVLHCVGVSRWIVEDGKTAVRREINLPAQYIVLAGIPSI